MTRSRWLLAFGGLLLLVCPGTPGCLTESRMLSTPAAGRPVEELLVRLRAQRPALRAGAARELGRRRVVVAVSLLTERLEDRAPEVRLAAVEGLGACGSSEAAQALARVLLGPDLELRIPAARALGRLPAGIAIPPLAAALSTQDPALRQEVARHLARHGLECLQPVWTRLREDGAAGLAAASAVIGAMAPAVQGPAVAALLGFAGEEAALAPRLVELLRPLGVAGVDPALGYLLSVDSEGAARLAARVLGALGEGIVPRLDAALVREVRSPAARTRAGRPPASPPGKKHSLMRLPRPLHRLGLVYLALGPRGLVALTDLHARADRRVRRAIDGLLRAFPVPAWEAALAQVEAGPPSPRRRSLLLQVERLEDLRLSAVWITPFLQDPDPVTALAAITVLRLRARDPATLHAPVLAASRHWAARLPDSLALVIQLLPLLGTTGPRAVLALLELRRSPHAGVRIAALEGLGRAGGAEARRELSAALGAADEREALEAVKGLAALKAVDELLGASSHKRPGVRREVLRNLGWMKDPRVGPRLVKALGDPDVECRLIALRSEGLRRDPAAPAAILRLLQDRSVPVVKAAVEALGKAGGAPAAAGLIRALGRKEPEVRRAAAQALGKLRARTAEAALTRLLKDPDTSVKQAAASAIYSITGKMPAGVTLPVTGVPACDRMLEIYRCIARNSGAAAQASMQTAIQQMEQSFRQSARTMPHAQLDAACTQAASGFRSAFASNPAFRSCLP